MENIELVSKSIQKTVEEIKKVDESKNRLISVTNNLSFELKKYHSSIHGISNFSDPKSFGL